MTNYNRGDVVLVRFIYSDETGEKQRPAVVISSDSYHKGRQEVIISAITSITYRILVGDHLITNWKSAGLLFPSVATGIIRTIKQNMIAKKLGKMPLRDMRAIDVKLLDSLALSSH
jgi:mRNA interferase MazF